MNIKKKNYDGWELDAMRNAIKFRKYQFILIKNFLKKNILEIGAGLGDFYKIYYSNKKKIYLNEVSSNIRKKLHKTINKKNTILINNYNKMKFDNILMMDVLEHIKYDKKFINSLHKNLKSNGILSISVPAFNFLYSEFDNKVGHFRRYNKKTIISIIDKKKYKVLNIKYYDSIGFIFLLIAKLLCLNPKKKIKTKVKIWNFLMPISKILDLLTLNLIGKSLIINLVKN